MIRPTGEIVFPKDEVLGAINAREGASEGFGLAVEVAKLLAARSGLSLKSILGQILWRHQGAKVLEDYRSIVEDITWAEEVSFGLRPSLLEEVFSERCDERGFLQAKRWREVVEKVCLNPLLRNRIWLTNADQLFFAERCRSATSESGMTFRQFKKLLLQLSDLLQAHPCIVLVSLCSHFQDQQVEAQSVHPK